MSAVSWPSSPLAAAERAFVLLTRPPASLEVDGGRFEGLPDVVLPLDRLRSVLLAPQTGPVVRDAVWRELVGRARGDGPAWVVAAVGVAMPGLRRAAGRLARGWRGDHHDLDAELLAGFLGRLASVDVDGPRICGRLIDAGVRAARRLRAAESDSGRVSGGEVDPFAPARPWDHPDLVLARAVAVGVIDADEAALIGATRLEGVLLARVAARWGISADQASSWRLQAERRLVEAVRGGELAWVSLRPRRQAGRRRANGGDPRVV